MGCRKYKFKTLSLAETHAEYLNNKNKKRRRKNSQMRAYECPDCDGFHLTHESLDSFKARINPKKEVYEDDVITNKIKQLQQKLNKK